MWILLNESVQLKAVGKLADIGSLMTKYFLVAIKIERLSVDLLKIFSFKAFVTRSKKELTNTSFWLFVVFISTVLPATQFH